MGGSNIMIRFKSPVLLLLLLLASCGRATTGSDPHGTVVLRDGTTITGTVLSTSSKEIQVVGDDQVTRTVPMSQVKSVEYTDTAAPSAEAPDSTAPARGAAAPPSSSSSSSPARPRAAKPAEHPAADPVHDEHYHPPASAVTTRTHQLDAGTEISVRNEETIDSS